MKISNNKLISEIKNQTVDLRSRRLKLPFIDSSPLILEVDFCVALLRTTPMIRLKNDACSTENK